jgi:DNA excision repair protein ERCC-6
MKPGFDDMQSASSASISRDPKAKSKKRKASVDSLDIASRHEPVTVDGELFSGDDYMPKSESEASLSDADYDEDLSESRPRKKGNKRAKSKRRRHSSSDAEEETVVHVDDGNEDLYQARLQKWCKRRQDARTRQMPAEPLAEDGEERPEWELPHPSRPDAVVDAEFKVPGDVYSALFDYQKTGVRWLWELYTQQVGGIVGDEMGLGKTIQVIAFLAGLHHGGKLSKPVVVVCPATVMKQWVNEFHRWWPPLRVSILHSSGSGMMNIRRESQYEDDLEDDSWDDRDYTGKKNQSSAKKIVDRVVRNGHVLVTTYSGLQTYSTLLLPQQWQYAVLDEGHKIRNPNTAITLYCKELRTPNRIILSGTPMQNNLTELWSLFDFVFPMRLGTLVMFRQQFEYPIKQGGYANASNLQVETAMRCAETLKDAISPYLLQRFKLDVASDLPKKTERVLFCKLTNLQRAQYESFLESEEMRSIMSGRRQPLYGVDILRKLCNHPDLVEHKVLSRKDGYNYGESTKSGKMQVVQSLLELWQKTGHRTLLFAQHRIMLDILEKFVRGMDGFRYLRMDGNTSIKDRQSLVDRFNQNGQMDVFLLTTKVGGLGVNLTGADRVIIYDPDWNPSTDVQARERAWRLGQKKEVEVYRLMTAGTIEEKIYHRQIFKQFLTNKILRDPKQRQTFHMSDLHDLFSLGDAGGKTETGTLFKGTEIQMDSKFESRAKNPAVPLRPARNPSHSSELAEIAPVVREEDFKNPEEDDGAEPKDKSERLLSAIFSRPDIHSAHEHDAILATNRMSSANEPDAERIAREARRVAGQAARELQRAGEIARTLPAGVPTWTGVFGTAGYEEEPAPRGIMARRGGGAGSAGRGGRPSSTSVLANLAARQGNAIGAVGGGSGESSRTTTPAPLHPRGKDFMAMIRDFLTAHGGSCVTQNLIDHFNRFCGTPQRTAEFKEMLSRIAVLEKGSRARGKWVLKKEFGGTV